MATLTHVENYITSTTTTFVSEILAENEHMECLAIKARVREVHCPHWAEMTMRSALAAWPTQQVSCNTFWKTTSCLRMVPTGWRVSCYVNWVSPAQPTPRAKIISKALAVCWILAMAINWILTAWAPQQSPRKWSIKLAIWYSSRASLLFPAPLTGGTALSQCPISLPRC